MYDGPSDPDEPHQGEDQNDVGPLSEDDLALYDKLADSEFADHAFEVLAVALVGYAFQVLCGWIATGELYRQCEKQGRPVWPSDRERDLLYRHHGEVEEIVNETLGEALVFLRTRAASGEQKWTREGGATLTTYFVGACVLMFPTMFRRWSRDLRHQPPTESYSGGGSAVTKLPAGDDPEAEVISEILTRKRLQAMPAHIRTIVELRLAGRTYAEIATLTGARSARSVEGMLQRHRDELRRRGEGGGW